MGLGRKECSCARDYELVRPRAMFLKADEVGGRSDTSMTSPKTAYSFLDRVIEEAKGRSLNKPAVS